MKVNDEARVGKGISQSVDTKWSRPLAQLDGGDLAIAMGAEFRQESTRFTPSALLLSNNIAGDRDSGLAAGSTTDLKATLDKRHVSSFFTELNAPFTKTVEAQFALRHDRYSEVGSTTNPKFGLRWQPDPTLLVRGSFGTGFRAPSLSDLKRPTTYGTASSFLTDPQCAAQEGSIDLCTDQWAVERRSNPNLKPERSQQFSMGVVFEPSKQWNLGLDYWMIRKTDVISTLGEQIIVENPGAYNGRYIQRDGDGFITNIILQKENQGALRTDGVDVNADWRGEAPSWGRPSVSLSGTWIHRYDDTAVFAWARRHQRHGRFFGIANFSRREAKAPAEALQWAGIEQPDVVLGEQHLRRSDDAIVLAPLSVVWFTDAADASLD